MKTGAIIQARMSSTRLPVKVAKELPYGSGITVLEQVVRRLRRCSLVDEVIVATTVEIEDDRIARLARKAGAKVFRGSKDDVLSRYFCAAREFSLDTVVRITCDCPCADPELVDSLIRRHRSSGADYTANIVKLTYPDGFDAEVFSFDALKTAHERALKKPEREHVTLFFRARPKLFKICSVTAPVRAQRPDLRVTLDTPEDYSLLCCVYDYLYRQKNFFGLSDVVGLFHAKPWLETINKSSMAKKVLRGERAELREALRVLQLQELPRAASRIRRILTK